jgi:hypothetical protein
MRITQILTLALLALATTACARQQVSYYTADPATHQPVPVVQRAAPNAPPQYAQASAQATAANGRGLLNTPQPAAQSYAQASYGQATYQAPPQQQASGRGLFNTYTEAHAVPAYAPPAYPRQVYAPPAAAPQRYAQQTYTQPSYAQPRNYAQGSAAPTQYQPQQYGSGGPFVAAQASNPFAQARWY